MLEARFLAAAPAPHHCMLFNSQHINSLEEVPESIGRCQKLEAL